MRSKENVPLKISVMPTSSTRQFEIRSNYHDTAGEWDDIYVDFSGFFGKFSPHTFAAAPELVEALAGAIGSLEYSVDCARDDGNNADIDFAQSKLDAALNALAKARGEA